MQVLNHLRGNHLPNSKYLALIPNNHKKAYHCKMVTMNKGYRVLQADARYYQQKTWFNLMILNSGIAKGWCSHWSCKSPQSQRLGVAPCIYNSLIGRTLQIHQSSPDQINHIPSYIKALSLMLNPSIPSLYPHGLCNHHSLHLIYPMHGKMPCKLH